MIRPGTHEFLIAGFKQSYFCSCVEILVLLRTELQLASGANSLDQCTAGDVRLKLPASTTYLNSFLEFLNDQFLDGIEFVIADLSRLG